MTSKPVSCPCLSGLFHFILLLHTSTLTQFSHTRIHRASALLPPTPALPGELRMSVAQKKKMSERRWKLRGLNVRMTAQKNVYWSQFSSSNKEINNALWSTFIIFRDNKPTVFGSHFNVTCRRRDTESSVQAAWPVIAGLVTPIKKRVPVGGGITKGIHIVSDRGCRVWEVQLYNHDTIQHHRPGWSVCEAFNTPCSLT